MYSKCEGKGCGLRSMCIRYITPEKERQSRIKERYNAELKHCPDFIEYILS